MIGLGAMRVNTVGIRISRDRFSGAERRGSIAALVGNGSGPQNGRKKRGIPCRCAVGVSPEPFKPYKGCVHGVVRRVRIVGTL